MVKSQATTMKIRNKKGRIHAAFSALDIPPGPFGSATLRSLVYRLFVQINPLDKYCLGLSGRRICPVPVSFRVVPAKAGTHTPRLIVLARGLTPSATTKAGGYGSSRFAKTTKPINGTMCRDDSLKPPAGLAASRRCRGLRRVQASESPSASVQSAHARRH